MRQRRYLARGTAMSLVFAAVMTGLVACTKFVVSPSVGEVCICPGLPERFTQRCALPPYNGGLSLNLKCSEGLAREPGPGSLFAGPVCQFSFTPSNPQLLKLFSYDISSGGLPPLGPGGVTVEVPFYGGNFPTVVQTLAIFPEDPIARQDPTWDPGDGTIYEPPSYQILVDVREIHTLQRLFTFVVRVTQNCPVNTAENDVERPVLLARLDRQGRVLGL